MIIASERVSLVEFLCGHLTILWNDWAADMQCTVLDALESEFALNGECPHCRRDCVFSMVTSAHQSKITGSSLLRVVAGMQCPGCRKYILGIIQRRQNDYEKWTYETHYPLGAPDDRVAGEIPSHIAQDFQEALRCRWVDAYNATVDMCRRALESSCIELGANPKDQIGAQIDWVHLQGKITTPLKEIAHKIRLGGNRGSHPAGDPDKDIPLTSNDADAVIDFTRHYFNHVYVMPQQLSKYDFSRTGRKASN